MEENDLTRELTFAKKAARAAGEILRGYYKREGLKVGSKGHDNPVTAADLEGYNVYRHEAGGVPVKVNTEPIRMPAFRDVQVVSGKKYFYSVSAMDQRGNESAQSEEASESVP